MTLSRRRALPLASPQGKPGRLEALFAFSLLLFGCSPTVTGWGHEAAQGALAEIGDAGAREVAAVVAAARDEALSPATDVALQTLVRDTGATARGQIAEAVQNSIVQALGPDTEARVGALREQLVGAPLRADLDALIAAEAPRLATALQIAISQSVQLALAPVRAEEERWRSLAVGLGVGALALASAVTFLALERRKHQKTIAKLQEGREGREGQEASRRPGVPCGEARESAKTSSP